MGNNQFAMVSGWMFNGNINEFIKVHRDANRFELVGFGPYYSPSVDNFLAVIAQRYRSGIDIHARRGDDTRGSKGGRFSNATITLLPPDVLFQRPTS